MFTLISIHSIQGFGFDTVAQIMGLTLSNWSYIENIPEIIIGKQLDKGISKIKPINQHEPCKGKLQNILEQHEAKDLPVYAVDSLMLFGDSNDPAGAVLNKKRLVINKPAFESLLENNQSNEKFNASQAIIGHEIGHIKSFEKQNTGHFWPMFTIASNIISYKIFEGILSSDEGMLYKCGSIATIATTQYLVNKAFFAFNLRMEEKKADAYAVKYASNPETLTALAKQFRQHSEYERTNLYNNIFGWHPRLSQRVRYLEENAKHKQFVAEKQKQPSMQHRIYNNTNINDID